MDNNETSKDLNGFVFCLPQFSIPTNSRSVRDEQKVLIDEAPKGLFSGTSVDVFPTITVLNRIVKRASQNVPAPSPAVHEAVQAYNGLLSARTELSNWLSLFCLTTPVAKIFPCNNYREFEDKVAEYESRIATLRSQFVNNYETLVGWWQSVLRADPLFGQTAQIRNKWADLVASVTPPSIEMQDCIAFSVITFQAARSVTDNSFESVVNSVPQYLFDGLAELVSKWHERNITDTKATTATAIKSLFDQVDQVLARYTFVDPRVAPIRQMATLAFNDALTASQATHGKALKDAALSRFVAFIRLMSNSAALQAVQDTAPALANAATASATPPLSPAAAIVTRRQQQEASATVESGVTAPAVAPVTPQPAVAAATPHQDAASSHREQALAVLRRNAAAMLNRT